MVCRRFNFPRRISIPSCSRRETSTALHSSNSATWLPDIPSSSRSTTTRRIGFGQAARLQRAPSPVAPDFRRFHRPRPTAFFACRSKALFSVFRSPMDAQGFIHHRLRQPRAQGLGGAKLTLIFPGLHERLLADILGGGGVVKNVVGDAKEKSPAHICTCPRKQLLHAGLEGACCSRRMILRWPFAGGVAAAFHHKRCAGRGRISMIPWKKVNP